MTTKYCVIFHDIHTRDNLMEVILRPSSSDLPETPTSSFLNDPIMDGWELVSVVSGSYFLRAGAFLYFHKKVEE